jgi:hypothetical protein
MGPGRQEIERRAASRGFSSPRAKRHLRRVATPHMCRATRCRYSKSPLSRFRRSEQRLTKSESLGALLVRERSRLAGPKSMSTQVHRSDQEPKHVERAWANSHGGQRRVGRTQCADACVYRYGMWESLVHSSATRPLWAPEMGKNHVSRRQPSRARWYIEGGYKPRGLWVLTIIYQAGTIMVLYCTVSCISRPSSFHCSTPPQPPAAVPCRHEYELREQNTPRSDTCPETAATPQVDNADRPSLH